MEQTFTYQHAAEKITDALGVSDELDNKCSEIIYFASICNHCMAEEIFESREDAPRSLVTITGDLEKALSLCSNTLEKDYVLLMFRTLHGAVADAIGKYKAINSLSESKKKQFDLMMKMMELRIKEAAKEEDADFIVPTEIFNKIKLVEKSNYNFDVYLDLLKSDVDDLINKAFNES